MATLWRLAGIDVYCGRREASCFPPSRRFMSAMTASNRPSIPPTSISSIHSPLTFLPLSHLIPPANSSRSFGQRPHPGAPPISRPARQNKDSIVNTGYTMFCHSLPGQSSTQPASVAYFHLIVHLLKHSFFQMYYFCWGRPCHMLCWLMTDLHCNGK